MAAPRPRAELVEHLDAQKRAIASSCTAFDSGEEWEAARLATSVYTMVHDGGAIRSILSQLGILGSLQFVTSGYKIDRKNLVADTPLIKMQISTATGVRYLPVLGERPTEIRQTTFADWWTRDLVYRDGGFELTRRRLVFALRHQDGGGHVGNLTDEAYVRFKMKATWYSMTSNRPPEPLAGASATTMRQIAWELMATLDQFGEVK